MLRYRRFTGSLLIAAAVLVACSDDDDGTSATIVDDPVSTSGGAAPTSGAATTEAVASTDAAANTDATTEVTTTDVATTPGADTATTPAGGDMPAGIADAVAALQTAAAAVPNGQPFDLEDDTFEGQSVWDIKVASDGNEFHFYVSSDGTSIVRQQQDDTPDDDVQKVESAQLTAVDALQVAASEVDGTLAEMEIDTTADGTVVWQVDMRQSDGSEVELIIDAVTGDVVT